LISRIRDLLVALLLLGSPAAALAQRSEPSSIEALEVSESIRLDGSLDEPAWQRTEHVSNFTQRELDFGAPASERTEVAILFDADALYIGFWAWDTDPRAIRANEMSRDFGWGADDVFEVVLDPFDDDRNGYLFVTNPNGARADALLAGGEPAPTSSW